MIIVSFFSLLGIFIKKIQNFSNIDTKIFTLSEFYRNSINEELLLYNTKIFYRGIKKSNQSYKSTTLQKWLDKKIYQNNGILFNPIYSDNELFSKCNQNLEELSQSIYPEMHYLCMQNFSIRMYRHQMSNFMKLAYQHRISLNKQFNLNTHNYSALPKSKLKRFSETFFYIQTANDKIMESVQNILQNEFINIQILQSKINSELSQFYWNGLTVNIIFLIMGIIVLNYMKKLYFREIIIVSFLNNEMIMKNKRVQSFLEMLSKSAY